MTREIGSHGSEVAAGVATELGLEIINSEIVVTHIAGSLGLEHSSVQRYLDGKATLFDRWQIDARKLSQYTLDHILNLALKDNVLIRGWGAAALFQGIRGVICVRICAPMALLHIVSEFARDNSSITGRVPNLSETLLGGQNVLDSPSGQRLFRCGGIAH